MPAIRLTIVISSPPLFAKTVKAGFAFWCKVGEKCSRSSEDTFMNSTVGMLGYDYAAVFTIHYSLFTIHYSLYSLLTIFTIDYIHY